MSAPPVVVLVTGYEAFGGETLNPSQLLVESWGEAAPSLPEGVELHLAVLPVARARVFDVLNDLLDELQPDILLALGQQGRDDQIALERFAHNRLHFSGRTDNDGHTADEEPLEVGGEARREATLPVGSLAATLAEQGEPIVVSEDAGSHLCNALLYTALGRPRAPRTTFVHLPLLPSQAACREGPGRGLELERQRAAVQALLTQILASS